MLKSIYKWFRKWRKRHMVHSKAAFDLKATEKLGIPAIMVRSNNRKFWFLVDSGAGYSTLNPDVIGKMKTEASSISGNAYGIDGAVKATAYRYAYFDIAGKKACTLCQVIESQSSWKIMEKEAGRRIAGLLGNNFLVKYRSVIDYIDLSVKNHKPRKNFVE